jgi:hypothetical protein
MMSLSPSTIRATWACQTNFDPFNPNEPAEWTDFELDISNHIELAYQSGISEIVISTGYRIDLTRQIQIHCLYSTRQRPIRRCTYPEDDSVSPIEREVSQKTRLQERYGFSLESESTVIDTHYRGSPFIMNWLAKVSENTLIIKYDQILKLLIQGIRKETQKYPEITSEALIRNLYKIGTDISCHKRSKQMKILRKKCVQLYTDENFLYRITNQTLRDNDVTKIDTLGPFCFLIYDFIGRQQNRNVHILHNLRRFLSKSQYKPIKVYRGDNVSEEKLEQYRQAIGDSKRCFKWLCFVSASMNMDVAKQFTKNILYEIDLDRYASNDQYATIMHISTYPGEEEVLLRPGVRFRIDQIRTSTDTNFVHTHIHVLPSFISSHQ